MQADKTYYSIADRIRAEVAGTWGKKESREWRITSDLHERLGVPDSGYDLLPFNVFQRATPLTVASAVGGGYLSDTVVTQGYLPALQPQCNLLRLGATQVSLDKTSTIIPRSTAPLLPTWLPLEGTPTVATAPVLGQVAFGRRIQLSCVTISRQLLLQSNADELVTRELIAGAATDMDRQGILGNGLLGTPLGLLNNPTITVASGAALVYLTLTNMMEAIANAAAIDRADCLGFLTTPHVANLLKNRYFSTAQFPIWNGSIASGTIDTVPAMSSTNVSAGALIHGDFSRLLMAQWEDGLQISVDPFTGFSTGLTTIRLILSVDFAVANPGSFQILNAIT
jgi:HK97 family phage major capsid protein